MTTTINNKNKKPNVPNLRFKEFQGEWEKCTLEDVMNFSTTRVNSSELNEGNYISTENMLQDYQGIVDAKSVPEDVNVISFSCGDILISNIRPYLKKVWKATYNGGCSSDVFVLKANDNIESDYLHYVIANDKFINFVMSGAKGVKMPRGDKNQMKTYSLSLPQIQEQKKIGKMLSLLDERIATQNKIIEDLKKLKSAIIEKVFNGKHSERLQLDNVGSYIRGLTYSSNDVVEHGGTLVMRSNNIVNGSLLDYNNNVVFVNKQMSAEQQLQNGDVVICMANGSSSLVGKSSFYDGSCHSPITVGAFCGIYRSKEPIVKWLFQTNKYRRYIWNSLQGGNGAIANLNGEDILNMSFSIPNATIKNTCVKMLTSMDSALENNMSLYALYTLQKQYLLRQMFI
ncbi:restriction endonuclease subunit S [Leyella stercorea]|uniref:restriction endonuclease subunit S n=1 Tax=Leyella stercorea TaxID=363265 RepID=UPI001F367ABC|nr:restriction endonuclease subunit S [Leyella stercorea]MCF2615049.1 restriction endonuclease subunit S [Leyella stercorea]